LDTKTIKQVVKFKVSTHELYEALMDSRKHSRFTGSPAKVDKKVGGKFSIYYGSLHGKTIELVKDKKIVQKWRSEMENWPEDHFSIVTFSFKKTKTGTDLTFTQTGIPSKCYASIKKGWTDYYWKPLKKMFR